MIQGTIIRVAGPVVDVQFTAGKLPALQEALTVTAEGTERTMEVTQHVNETTVRCIMLSASEGLGKGMTVTATGHGLTAPVGEATLGRMFDPLGISQNENQFFHAFLLAFSEFCEQDRPKAQFPSFVSRKN